MYRCNQCEKIFNTADFYFEKHNLDSPPYERIAVCPYCGNDDFEKYDINIEKIDVAEKILPAIAALNRYWSGIKDVFGNDCINDEFSEVFYELCEFVSELFPFLSVEKEKQIINMHSENDIEKILVYLRG